MEDNESCVEEYLNKPKYLLSNKTKFLGLTTAQDLSWISLMRPNVCHWLFPVLRNGSWYLESKWAWHYTPLSCRSLSTSWTNLSAAGRNEQPNAEGTGRQNRKIRGYLNGFPLWHRAWKRSLYKMKNWHLGEETISSFLHGVALHFAFV